MSDPVHMTLLVLDIEKFGPRRHIEQAEAQRVMYACLRKVLLTAEVEQTSTHTEDRGDGVFVVLDADVPKAKLIRSVLTELPTALYDHNRLASDGAKIRMRAAVHAGDVERTDESVIGTPAIEVFRLLNSEKLHTQLAESEEPLVFAVTDSIYRDVIRHDHSGVRADRFHPIDADDKEPLVAAWIYATTPTGEALQAAPPSPKPQPSALTPPTITAGNYISSGVTVQGDVFSGNKTVNGR